jgi:hypothetical protein
MKKTHLVMLGVMALAAGAVQADQPAAPQAETQAVAFDEAAFVAKLSETHQKMFNLMNADQRKSVAAAASSDTADAAVEKVMKEHNLALVNGELKADVK